MSRPWCVLLLAACSCGGETRSEKPPDGSEADAEVPTPQAACASEPRQFDAMGLFTFVAPCELVGGPEQGIDSYVGAYASPTLELSYDYGIHSSSLEEFAGEPAYLEWTTLIDSRSAKLVVCEVEWSTFPLSVCVHFSKVFEPQGVLSPDMLTICGSGATPADRQTVADIYMSIDFPDP